LPSVSGGAPAGKGATAARAAAGETNSTKLSVALMPKGASESLPSVEGWKGAVAGSEC
jgi:hypothetical protein